MAKRGFINVFKNKGRLKKQTSALNRAQKQINVLNKQLEKTSDAEGRKSLLQQRDPFMQLQKRLQSNINVTKQFGIHHTSLQRDINEFYEKLRGNSQYVRDGGNIIIGDTMFNFDNGKLNIVGVRHPKKENEWIYSDDGEYTTY